MQGHDAHCAVAGGATPRARYHVHGAPLLPAEGGGGGTAARVPLSGEGGRRLRPLVGLLSLAAAVCATARPFILGSDLSYLDVLDCGGTCSPFRATAGGPTGDALAMTAAGGWTHVRIRIWVDPSTHSSSPYPPGPGGTDDTYANLTGVLALSRRVHAAGLAVWLDFHYSLTWADPGKQAKPSAWVGLSATQLASAVAAHTNATLTALAQQGTPADVVQVGNEVTAGMLWPAQGESCAQSGALDAKGCSAEPGGNWPVFASLISAGQAAVRAATPSALLVMHTDLGNALGAAGGVARIIDWYAHLAANGATEYDAIGLSFYPQWGGGTSSNLQQLTAVRAAFPDKALVIAETAYASEGRTTPGAEFPFSPAGQAQWVRAVAAQVRSLPGGAGCGYWGAEFFAISPNALWDGAGVAKPALTAFA